MIKTCDRCARTSVIIGVIGAILTGLIHWGIAASSHFDLLARDAEFYLVMSVSLVIVGLSIWNISLGMNAINHLHEPHGKFARPLALAGITFGLADVLPAVLLLSIMVETALLRIIILNNWLQF